MAHHVPAIILDGSNLLIGTKGRVYMTRTVVLQQYLTTIDFGPHPKQVLSKAGRLPAGLSTFFLDHPQPGFRRKADGGTRANRLVTCRPHTLMGWKWKTRPLILAGNTWRVEIAPV